MSSIWILFDCLLVAANLAMAISYPNDPVTHVSAFVAGFLLYSLISTDNFIKDSDNYVKKLEYFRGLYEKKAAVLDIAIQTYEEAKTLCGLEITTPTEEKADLVDGTNVCVICGRPWIPGCKNRCECGGMCSWGKSKGADPDSWVRQEDGTFTLRPVPTEVLKQVERVASDS